MKVLDVAQKPTGAGTVAVEVTYSLSRRTYYFGNDWNAANRFEHDIRMQIEDAEAPDTGRTIPNEDTGRP